MMTTRKRKSTQPTQEGTEPKRKRTTSNSAARSAAPSTRGTSTRKRRVSDDSSEGTVDDDSSVEMPTRNRGRQRLSFTEAMTTGPISETSTSSSVVPEIVTSSRRLSGAAVAAASSSPRSVTNTPRKSISTQSRGNPSEVVTPISLHARASSSTPAPLPARSTTRRQSLNVPTIPEHNPIAAGIATVSVSSALPTMNGVSTLPENTTVAIAPSATFPTDQQMPSQHQTEDALNHILPVNVLENSNTWYSWLSAFFLVLLVSSSFFAQMYLPPATLAPQKTQTNVTQQNGVDTLSKVTSNLRDDIARIRLPDITIMQALHDETAQEHNATISLFESALKMGVKTIEDDVDDLLIFDDESAYLSGVNQSLQELEDALDAIERELPAVVSEKEVLPEDDRIFSSAFEVAESDDYLSVEQPVTSATSVDEQHAREELTASTAAHLQAEKERVEQQMIDMESKLAQSVELITNDVERVLSTEVSFEAIAQVSEDAAFVAEELAELVTGAISNADTIVTEVVPAYPPVAVDSTSSAVEEDVDLELVEDMESLSDSLLNVSQQPEVLAGVQAIWSASVQEVIAGVQRASADVLADFVSSAPENDQEVYDAVGTAQALMQDALTQEASTFFSTLDAQTRQQRANLLRRAAEAAEEVVETVEVEKEVFPTVFQLLGLDNDVAESPTGARMLSKESTRQCLKKKALPFVCHRPLNTVNSYVPLSSSEDCFVFTLPSSASSSQANNNNNVYNNALTVQFSVPAKVRALGLTHYEDFAFDAQQQQDASRFNVSCAPYAVSFTLHEVVQSSQQDSLEEGEAIASSASSLAVPETKKKTKGPLSFLFANNIKDKTNNQQVMEIQQTLETAFFTPEEASTEVSSSSIVARVSPSLQGTNITQIWTLQDLGYLGATSASSPTETAHVVRKVTMRVLSTQRSRHTSGGISSDAKERACVYRLHVWGSFDEAQQ